MSKKVVCISGASTTGKSRSLKYLTNPEKVLYLNCEGKDLPFKDTFGKSVTITNPQQVIDGIAWAEKNKFETVVVDSLTYLMDMYESEIVLKSSNGMKAWSDYAQYVKNLMQQVVPKSPLNFIFLAHTRTDLDEATGEHTTQIPIKGALKNQGIESYFTIVVSTKKMPVKRLKAYENDLLTYTEKEEAVGVKYVFQTQLTKETVNERVRGPDDLWELQETYIDNNCQALLDRIIQYYK